ncbi:MAG: hypothetical protein ACLGHT_00785 [Acidimicrobiia bacterium]
MQFRLTRRALKDLDLPIEQYAHRPATDYVDAHAVIRTFVEQRRQDPSGQEWTRLPVTAAPAYNLHHGRYRGLTWHDEESDVVWLLGVGWHESGSQDDAYAVLKRRDEAGTLMPTEEDYLDLELTLEQAYLFATQVAEQAPALIEKARERPGEEIRGVIAERLGVGVVVEIVVVPGEDESLEEIWIGFAMPPMPGACDLPPQPEWINLVLAAMLPFGANLADAEFGGNFPRSGGSKPNEIVICWRSF